MAAVQAQLVETMASNDQDDEYVPSQKVLNLYNKMIMELDAEIAPCEGMMDNWNRLLTFFSNGAPLNTKEKNSIKKIEDLVNKLKEKEYITFENFEPFAEKLENVHKQMARRVRVYAERIKQQITSERDSVTKAEKKKGKGKYTAVQEKSDESEEDDIDANKEDDEDEDERSSQLSEIERLHLQADMIVELSDCLDANQKDEWAKFMTKLEVYFKPGVLSKIHNVMDAFNKLKKRGHVRLGFYDVLKDMVHPIDEDMSGIIDKFSAKINRGLPAREPKKTGKGTKRRTSAGSERNVPTPKKSRRS